jgi:hypothetical protein
MGFSYPRLRASGLISFACLLSGAAHAGELLHMPYACRFDGAVVNLLPSEDRGYEVIGGREREIHTACSPSEPDRCLSWFVHRFDLDCGGARVSWLEVAEAAAREGGRDVWVDDGRFSMRMGRFWSVARGGDRGTARRRWRREAPLSDAFDEFGSGGGGNRGRRIVTLPPGFAPALGVPIAFSGTGGVERDAEMTPEPSLPSADGGPMPAAPAYREPSTYDDYADRAPAERIPERSPPAMDDAPAEVAANDVAPEPQPVPELPERAPRREMKMAAAAAETTVATVAPATQPEPASADTVAASARDASAPSGDDETFDAPVASSVPGNIKPVIINAPRSASEKDKTKPAPSAVTQPPATQDAEQAHEVAPPAPQLAVPTETGSMLTAASNLPAGLEAEPPVETGRQTMPVSLATMAASAAVLALAAFAAFGFWRWNRADAVPAQPTDRDLASVSFGNGPAGDVRKEPQLGLKGATPAERKVAARVEAAKREAGHTDEELPVPTTYEQALAALGVRADATVDAVKKIVDGLRRTCHPDHATSEADRLYREHRLRQVNVAWDLVSGKRASTA